jgi:hypothetical protein
MGGRGKMAKREIMDGDHGRTRATHRNEVRFMIKIAVSSPTEEKEERVFPELGNRRGKPI